MSADLTDEWSYRYHERLALLGCFGTPTDDQDRIARTEAEQAVRELERNRISQHRPKN